MQLLDQLIAMFPTAKRQTLKRMLTDRRVMVNGQAARSLHQPVEPSDAIRILPSRPAEQTDLPFRIVFEDRDVLVIDKPPGLLTSTTPRERRPTALAAARAHAQPERGAKIGLIHRLDRDASGLLVFAKSAAAMAGLKRQFARHSVSRVYAAVVSPPPRKMKGTIDTRLVEHADGRVTSARSADRGQRAVTEFRVEQRDGDLALLAVTLLTGRKHQIRAHLSEMQSPIVGDAMYGGRPDQRGLMLAAVELQFDHPRHGRRMAFRLPLPPRLAAAMPAGAAERKENGPG